MRIHRLWLATALAVVAAVFAVPSALAGAVEAIEPLTPAPNADSTTPVAEGTNLWFVELASPPAVKGTSTAKLNAEKQAFRKAAREAGVGYSERLAFGKLWNGLSVRVSDPSQVSALSRLPGVRAVYPVLTATLPPTTSVSPDLATAIGLTGADNAHDSGYTGEGVRVAVMDSGIDYDHPDLGGDGTARENSTAFPNSRVVAGWDFVGDTFNANPTAPDYNPTPSPDPYPDDCADGASAGHGTHVAGIVGAGGGVTGVAPEADLGAYRVFGCNGSTTADIMIAAMERALTDDMDALNMSIGSAFANWSQYPTAAAADALVDQGMVVVASIGNSGANGIWSAGAPGVGDKVIGVASFDNSHINALTFDVNPNGPQVAYLPLSTTPDPPTSGTSDEVVYLGRGCVSTLGDTHLADGSGKTALMIRGDCTFEEKYQGAADAGATAVVIYNQNPGLFAGGGVTSRGIPGVAISNADGVAIRALLDGGETVTLTWTDVRVNAPNPTGGLISSFSSYGLGAELAVKPDIGAPGGLIRSTYPLAAGGYAIISGTSMSSPHVAGAVALLLQARPGTPAAEVRALLQNSADPRPWWGNPGLGFLDNVHRQGAGMLDIDDSISAPARVTPGKIALGEAGAPLSQTLTIRNDSDAVITYALSHTGALGTFGSTFVPGFTLFGASASFSAPSVVVPANGTATVDVTLTRPDAGAANKVVYGGYVVLTPEGGGQVLRVPYAGFAGDYQGFPVMTGGGQTVPFPKLARHVGYVSASDFTPTFAFPADPVTYTLTTTTEHGRPVVDAPTVAVHLDHQARWLRMTLLDADGVRVGGPNSLVHSEEFLPRNATSGGFFAFAWDGAFTKVLRNGKVIKAPLEDGQYRLRIDILKAGGNEATPGHTESYTSPVFTLDRP